MTQFVSFYVIAWHVLSQIRDKTSQICRIIAVRWNKTCHPSGCFITNLRKTSQIRLKTVIHRLVYCGRMACFMSSHDLFYAKMFIL